jgi:hypothetical protein
MTERPDVAARVDPAADIICSAPCKAASPSSPRSFRAGRPTRRPGGARAISEMPKSMTLMIDAVRSPRNEQIARLEVAVDDADECASAMASHACRT